MAQFYSPDRRVTTRQTISVTATDLDAFGQGVARHRGKAIFIPGLLPEEQAEVVITEDKRQFSKGKIKKLLIRSPQRVLDLFCGMGNFTLPLAKCAKEVVGVEGVTTLVANAQYNARINLVNNVSFFHANLEDETTWQQWATQDFEKVLLDPARAGAPGVMPHIATLAPKRVVYVSCNPATLARDSKILLEAGYRLAQLRMLDMFPHTGHLESMALFINQSEE
ncbi:23S rRNA (uracil(1939)-C(5))-methyltransferase RlmD [Edaphovirga cremea]|uniref:23S rRNA (uracil(1939)-C(5))-methyltransferase RlmD n=1 Tax=Edaphovirga cremea TaxID=2267246 RepID=UPI000DEFEE76|nr:23S rRNA (uracil(1939)-C(5))-methyltransferase RlmD [Edaphovirga cremea]